MFAELPILEEARVVSLDTIQKALIALPILWTLAVVAVLAYVFRSRTVFVVGLAGALASLVVPEEWPWSQTRHANYGWDVTNIILGHMYAHYYHSRFWAPVCGAVGVLLGLLLDAHHRSQDTSGSEGPGSKKSELCDASPK